MFCSQQYCLDVMSGRRRGPAAAVLRLCLAALEPAYGAAARARNHLYDRRILWSQTLGRPTISVGNLTTGGTGKTPLVGWLVAALSAAGHKPAVLMRGYGRGDEERLLSQARPCAPVLANPNRLRGAAAALRDHPEVDLFILDDAMQHRRVARDVEIVLISAVTPWGFGRLLPRGLLREPLTGLSRATAIVVTHRGEVPPSKLAEIETTVRRFNATAPILHADHQLSGFIAADGEARALGEARYWIACGIGQPESFVAAMRSQWKQCAGHTFFSDHHAFTEVDALMLRRAAGEATAEAIVVTEKDWTKLSRLATARQPGIPFLRAKLNFQFSDDGGRTLLDLITQRSRST